MVEHKVEARLVEGYGVERGQYTDVAHLWCRRATVAVAVNRKVVHHIDVYHPAAEIVVNGLCCRSHRFEKGVLTLPVVEYLVGVPVVAGSVYQCLAFARSHPDALVFQHTAEAAHRVPLKVGDVDKEVIVGNMAAHTVKLYVGVVGDGYVQASVLVHDVYSGNVVEASFRNGPAVAFCV